MIESKPITHYLSLFQKNFAFIKNIYEEQEKMAIQMINALTNTGTIIVCQGPTGMGKSLVIDAVAMKLADEQKKVLISSPVYSALNDNHLSPLQHLKVDTAILHGISWWKKQDYKCPKDNTVYPSKFLCTKRKCDEKSCLVYQEYEDIRNKNIVLTVHHKIASTPAIIREEKFDIVMIDESHNLPQIIENLAYQKMSTDELNTSFSKLGKISPRIRKIMDKAVVSNTIKEVEKRKVLREVRRISASTSQTDDLFFLAQALKLDFINGDWIFYSPPRKRAKRHPNLSVALVSATIERPLEHISDCRFDSLTQAPAFRLGLTERFRKRFQKRPIFYLSDGPILRKDRDSPDVYQDFRKQANNMIYNIVDVVSDQVTLILCRSNKDAKSIKNTLEKSERLQKNLIYLGDEDPRESDEIEEFLSQEIKKGKKLIISTAKNGLWEGANVPDLRCVIIDSLPYRAPNPSEDPLKSKGGFYRSSMFRFMLRRLQQGIGRLVRKDGEWGIAIIIDGRMYTGKRWIHKQLPVWISDSNFIYLEKMETIVDKVQKMKKNLISGKIGTKSVGLPEFFE